MLNMIKADFYRLIRSKGIFIALGIMFLMIAVDVYSIQPGSLGMRIETESTMESNPMEQPSQLNLELSAMSLSDFREMMLQHAKGYALDRDILACNMNLYYIFIFAAAILIATEFSNSTIKNTLSSASSRKQYFLSKLITANGCCIVLFFFNTYLAYFGNLWFNHARFTSSLGTVTKVTLLQLPPVLMLANLLIGLAFLLKKLSVFNTVSIPLMMIFEMIFSLFISQFPAKQEILDYTPQNMLAQLANTSPSESYFLRSYLICAIVILLSAAVGWLSFRKTEIC